VPSGTPAGFMLITGQATIAEKFWVALGEMPFVAVKVRG